MKLKITLMQRYVEMPLNEFIIQQIRNRRAIFKKRPKRIPRKPRYPYQAERAYRRYLLEYVREYFNLVNELLIPRLPGLAAQAVSFRPDSLVVRIDSWVEDLAAIIAQISFTFKERTERKMILNIEKIAKETSDYNEDDIQAVIRSVIGVDVFKQEPWLSDQLKSFVAENTGYVIKNLPTNATAQIQGIAQRGLQQGKTAKDIGKELSKQFGITKRRAEFIARDQVSKLNGNLTQLRQQEIGVSQYRWRTVRDNRVRPEHEEREGVIFSWSAPPKDGHPGQPINCRCIAEPLLDTLLESI